MHDRAASRALLGKGGVYTLATAAQLTGALLVQPVLSRLLSRAEYGRVALAVVVTSLLGLVLTVGLPAVITREYFQQGGRLAARTLATITSAIAVCFGLLVLVTGPLWAAPLGSFDMPLVLGAATAITFSIITTGQAMLRAREQAGRFVLVVIVNVLGGQFTGLTGILIIEPAASVYLAGVGIGSLVAALLSLWWSRPALPSTSDRVMMRQWFSIALPTVPHTVALYLMAAGDRFIVDIQLGPEVVAGYSLAYLAGTLGTTLVAAANNAWAPLIYNTPDEKRWSVLATTTRDMARLGALLAGGLALAAPLALWIIADPAKYNIQELVPVLAITALSTIPYILYLASAHVLFWTGKTKALLWITPSAVLVNLGVKTLVVPWAGLVGAAVVTVGSYTLLMVLVAGARRSLAKVPWTGRWSSWALATVCCTLGALLPLTPLGYVVRLAAILILIVLGLLVVRSLRRVSVASSARQSSGDHRQSGPQPSRVSLP